MCTFMWILKINSFIISNMYLSPSQQTNWEIIRSNVIFTEWLLNALEHILSRVHNIFVILVALSFHLHNVIVIHLFLFVLQLCLVFITHKFKQWLIHTISSWLCDDTNIEGKGHRNDVVHPDVALFTVLLLWHITLEGQKWVLH